MTSIEDIGNQINAKLDSIVQNTSDTVTNTHDMVTVGNGIRSDLTEVNTKLDTLDTHLQSGVTELARGLFAILEQQKVTNSILDFHSRQNDTIICLLENSNTLLCGITRKFTSQLELSEKLLKSLKRVEGIAERAQPAAAADYDRLAGLQRQISECCPGEEPVPEPCPEACAVPKQDIYEPKGQDWQP